MTGPRFSIITPVYNGARFVEETVESVLAQECRDFEYLLLDDGSTDDTAARLRRFAGDPRVTLLSHPNMGEAATVNRGVGLARGEIVGVVNADDPVRPGLLAAMRDVFASHPERVAAYPDWMRIDEAGRVLREERTHDYDFAVLLGQHLCLPGPGTFFRRSALRGEPARNPAYRYNSDYELWLRLALRGDFVRVPRVLATWREHPGGASHFGRGAEMARNRIDVIRDLLARDDLPEIPDWLRRQALSAAYYCAAILVLQDPAVPARRYMLASLRAKARWQGRVVPERRRSWRLMLFCLGFPLTWPLQRLYPRVALGAGRGPVLH